MRVMVNKRTMAGERVILVPRPGSHLVPVVLRGQAGGAFADQLATAIQAMSEQERPARPDPIEQT